MSDAEEEVGGEVEEDEEEWTTHCAGDGGMDAARGGEHAGAGDLTEGKKKRKKKKPLVIRINLTSCKYEVLRIATRRLSWKEVDDSEEWEVFWTDASVSMDRVLKMNRFQKINHFSGMLELCRKRLMAKNLQKMYKLFPEHYDFFPRTFVLPSDINEFLADVRVKGKKQFYIIKPDAGCQGRGIRLVQGGKDEKVQKMLQEMDANLVAQHYLHKPHLVHGYKYDMRVYTLVLSCDPLRVFIFKEGLTRICTEKYATPKSSNIGVAYMHLTNYAVNKHNDNFTQNDGDDSIKEAASKWSFAQLAEYINGCGHNWERVWSSIHDIIMKSIISVQPVLRNNYRSALPPDNDGFSCFELLGYDVMLDSDLQPWLIEVNHSASFNIDSPLDLAIKSELIYDTLNLVRVDPKLIQRAKKIEKRNAAARMMGLQPPKKPTVTPIGSTAASGTATTTAAAASATATAAALAALAADESNDDADDIADIGTMPGLPSDWKPKTAEEYESWRADILRRRLKYEEENSGGYMRIYPSDDPKQQALYEELLKGSNDIYYSAFCRPNPNRSRPEMSLSEERRKKNISSAQSSRVDSAEPDFETARLDKARVKAHRDRLALQHAERRKAKELNPPDAARSTGPYYSYGGVYSAGGTYGLAPTLGYGGPSMQYGTAQVMAQGGVSGHGFNGIITNGCYPLLQHMPGHNDHELESHPGYECWGESDDGGSTDSDASYQEGSGLHRCGSLSSTLQNLSINCGGQVSHPQAGVSASSSSAVAALNQRANSAAPAIRREGAATGGGSTGSTGTAASYSTINLGALPPSPFRGVVYPGTSWEQRPISTPLSSPRGGRGLGWEAVIQQHNTAAAAASGTAGEQHSPRVSAAAAAAGAAAAAVQAQHQPGSELSHTSPLPPSSPEELLSSCHPQPSSAALHEASGGPRTRFGLGGSCEGVLTSPRGDPSAPQGGGGPEQQPGSTPQLSGFGGTASSCWSRFILPTNPAESNGGGGVGSRSISSAVPQSPRLIDKLQPAPPRVGFDADGVTHRVSTQGLSAVSAYQHQQQQQQKQTITSHAAAAAAATPHQQHQLSEELPKSPFTSFGAASADAAPAAVTSSASPCPRLALPASPCPRLTLPAAAAAAAAHTTDEVTRPGLVDMRGPVPPPEANPSSQLELLIKPITPRGGPDGSSGGSAGVPTIRRPVTSDGTTSHHSRRVSLRISASCRTLPVGDSQNGRARASQRGAPTASPAQVTGMGCVGGVSSDSSALQGGPGTLSGVRGSAAGAAFSRHATVTPAMGLAAVPSSTWRTSSAATSPLKGRGTGGPGGPAAGGGTRTAEGVTCTMYRKYSTEGSEAKSESHLPTTTFTDLLLDTTTTTPIHHTSYPGEGAVAKRESSLTADPPTLGGVRLKSASPIPPTCTASTGQTGGSVQGLYTRAINNPAGVAGTKTVGTASAGTKTRGVLYSAVRPMSGTASSIGGGGGAGGGGTAGVPGVEGIPPQAGASGRALSSSARRALAQEAQRTASQVVLETQKRAFAPMRPYFTISGLRCSGATLQGQP